MLKSKILAFWQNRPNTNDFRVFILIEAANEVYVEIQYKLSVVFFSAFL
jgi:hypothetical protein